MGKGVRDRTGKGERTMRVTRKDKEVVSRKIEAAFIPVGTVFDWGWVKGEGPFLRTYDSVVDLSNPSQTWGLAVIVVGYQPLVVELVVHHPE